MVRRKPFGRGFGGFDEGQKDFVTKNVESFKEKHFGGFSKLMKKSWKQIFESLELI